MLCCCLGALHKSPGKLIKCWVHLPHSSQPQGFIPPSRRPCWSTASPLFPLAYQVPSQTSLCTASPTGDFQPTRKRDTTPLPYHLCTDLGYIPLCYAKYQYLAFKASLDGHKKHRALHQTSPKQSINRWRFLQHLCIHKANAVLFHPMNTSCCTVPPTKLENSSWGVKPQLKWLLTVQAQASQQDNGPRE